METSVAQKPAQLSELEQRHHQYEERLNVLAAISYLSVEEELEETRLKKLKLQIKDQIKDEMNQIHA